MARNPKLHAVTRNIANLDAERDVIISGYHTACGRNVENTQMLAEDPIHATCEACLAAVREGFSIDADVASMETTGATSIRWARIAVDRHHAEVGLAKSRLETAQNLLARAKRRLSNAKSK